MGRQDLRPPLEAEGSNPSLVSASFGTARSYGRLGRFLPSRGLGIYLR